MSVELVFILEGEVVLIDDSGETVLKPGDAAGFKANDPNGHHLVNRSSRDVLLLEIGSRSKHERAEYLHACAPRCRTRDAGRAGEG